MSSPQPSSCSVPLPITTDTPLSLVVMSQTLHSIYTGDTPQNTRLITCGDYKTSKEITVPGLMNTKMTYKAGVKVPVPVWAQASDLSNITAFFIEYADMVSAPISCELDSPCPIIYSEKASYRISTSDVYKYDHCTTSYVDSKLKGKVYLTRLPGTGLGWSPVKSPENEWRIEKINSTLAAVGNVAEFESKLPSSPNFLVLGDEILLRSTTDASFYFFAQDTKTDILGKVAISKKTSRPFGGAIGVTNTTTSDTDMPRATISLQQYNSETKTFQITQILKTPTQNITQTDCDDAVNKSLTLCQRSAQGDKNITYAWAQPTWNKDSLSFSCPKDFTPLVSDTSSSSESDSSQSASESVATSPQEIIKKAVASRWFVPSLSAVVALIALALGGVVFLVYSGRWRPSFLSASSSSSSQPSLSPIKPIASA